MRVKVIRCPSMSILIEEAVNNCIQELESKGNIVIDIKLNNEIIMVIYEESAADQSYSYKLTTVNDTNNYVGDFVVTVG